MNALGTGLLPTPPPAARGRRALLMSKYGQGRPAPPTPARDSRRAAAATVLPRRHLGPCHVSQGAGEGTPPDSGAAKRVLPHRRRAAVSLPSSVGVSRTPKQGSRVPGARKTASPSATPPGRRPRPSELTALADPGDNSRGGPVPVLTPWLKPLEGAAAEPGATAAAAKANAAAGTAASNTPWRPRTLGGLEEGRHPLAGKNYIYEREEEKWPQRGVRGSFIDFASKRTHHTAHPSATVT